MALTGGERLLDCGCGPGVFARTAAARHPGLTVIALDPSRDFARSDHHDDRVFTVRAAGEALPLADGSIDVAICLSSIRHVRDRSRTFHELRRVVTGKLLIVELDPASSPERQHAHSDHLPALLRAAFGPLVLRTAPPADAIAKIAIDAGFRQHALDTDPIQPVYILELV
jgi:ubiquinone/menaquinone biosynthesis C-methylase UbiE